ncbi:phytanoyl-CoA dioxygenase family protein [Akkermansiaceae bacterium]|nr:phytanoyl-CoA dioxygenase family protein [bacterium]MDA7616183.1 phytanoyl-CoA dioxygenase family protein [Akkermansiaceae bacterium]MDA7683167.1 phytanoyl-CoA dioxygenase family protein [Akkermansiaceae bacterium]MDB4633293.1 phytanoyl-CoA dioxygenase family protein [Akkermansiaceae bacterium]MDB4706850.1 phytanoyl-CoA dioxygenase family protein [Akkermansiaceae bacterium]
MKLLTEEQLSDYDRDGYIVVRNLFSKDEIDSLGHAARSDNEMDKSSTQRDDGEGNAVRLALWNHPGDGIYGMFARCRKMVDRVEEILKDEAYHYHSKMILKDAKVGGAWAWHQDYGYWYQNGVLSPNLCSVMIAVDQATIENGCMQVIKGSHKLGRINHILSGDQAGADMERVEEAKKRLGLVHVTMDPGDALFFHSNTLHASDANESDHPRWAMICCYNAASNDPYKDSHHPRYTKLEKVEDNRILAIETNHASRMHTDFADLNRDDTSAKSLKKSQSP